MESKTAVNKEQIIRASRNVFKTLGYNKVTMADVAYAANMGRSSLYYYFKNKDEVFFAVSAVEFSNILAKAQTKTKATQSFYDNFLAFNKERLTSLSILVNDFQNLLNDIRENANILYFMRNICFEQEFSIYKQMLTWGIKRNDIAAISAEDLQFLTSNMIYAFKGFEQEVLLFGKIEELTNRLDWVASIVSKGLK